MSESTFDPFASPVDAAYEEQASEQADSRRNLLLLGGLGAVVLAGAAYFFLGGSSDDTTELTPTALPPASSRTVTPAPESETTEGLAIPTVTALQLGRNPFKALYVEPASSGPAGGGDGNGAPPAGGSTGGPSTGLGDLGGGTASAPSLPGGGSPAKPGDSSGGPVITLPALPSLPAVPTLPSQPSFPSLPLPVPDAGGGTGGGPGGGTGGGSGGGTGGGSTKPAQSTVALGKVAVVDGKPTGTFLYDGQTLTGKPGDVMGGRLLVISLQQDPTGAWFANLQLGDGTPFEVHQRQTVVVQ